MSGSNPHDDPLVNKQHTPPFDLTTDEKLPVDEERPEDTMKRIIKRLDGDATRAARMVTRDAGGAVTLHRQGEAITEAETKPAPHDPPWTLQQFFEGEIDLDVELSKRFPSMPMLSRIKLRTLGTLSNRRVATMTSQDESAQLIIDADMQTKVIQMSFTLGSMLTLRFTLDDLSDMDRDRWVELMRREQGGLAFLWGPARWSNDYLICISRKYHTHIYAFSPNNFDAGIRMTPAVTVQLLDWLETVWDAPPEDDIDADNLLTW